MKQNEIVVAFRHAPEFVRLSHKQHNFFHVRKWINLTALHNLIEMVKSCQYVKRIQLVLFVAGGECDIFWVHWKI